VLIATGRMFRSVRPYLADAKIHEPVICYQGAAVIEPESGVYLVHETVDVRLAREVIDALAEVGHSPNVYVGDELYVAKHTEYSRAYAEFQHLDVAEVGDLGAWLETPPTKIVTVAKPEEIPAIRAHLGDRFGQRLFLTRSLPFLLEISHPDASKGTGLSFVADRLGLDVERIVAFGDGENDLELLETAGFGIAVGDADPVLLAIADGTCEGPMHEGVATVIDAALDSLA
jgi:Cof subfamily protein (haloacid dehalogenase superfamily)